VPEVEFEVSKVLSPEYVAVREEYVPTTGCHEEQTAIPLFTTIAEHP
jgi:hypothetical protein